MKQLWLVHPDLLPLTGVTCRSSLWIFFCWSWPSLEALLASSVRSCRCCSFCSTSSKSFSMLEVFIKSSCCWWRASWVTLRSNSFSNCAYGRKRPKETRKAQSLSSQQRAGDERLANTTVPSISAQGQNCVKYSWAQGTTAQLLYPVLCQPVARPNSHIYHKLHLPCHCAFITQ